MLWLLELQIRRGRKVHTVNSNSRTSYCQFSLFSKKYPVVGIFCISGRLVVPVNPDKWSSAISTHILKITLNSHFVQLNNNVNTISTFHNILKLTVTLNVASS